MQDKKNVLLIIPSLHQGGAERKCIRTANLLKDDFNVTIAVFDGSKNHYDTDGLNVVDLNLPAASGKINKIFRLKKRISALKKLKHDLNIHYSYSLGSTASLSNVFAKANDKIFTAITGFITLENKFEMKLYSRNAHRVVFCSNDMLEYSKKTYNTKNGCYLYNPLPSAEIIESANSESVVYPFSREDGYRIISMGRDDDQKGFWHLIKAFASVHENIPNSNLTIIGEGSFEKAKSLCSLLGISDHVSFTGPMKNPFPYINEADLFVMTSNHEGFPNSLIEAMALKKPVIACNCKTGPAEILLSEKDYKKSDNNAMLSDYINDVIHGEYGILLPDMSHTPDYLSDVITDEQKRLGDEIISLLQDEDLRNAYGEKGFNRVQDFSPELYKENLVRIFDM